MMFNGCKGLETLDLSSFNTSNVAYMIYMFSECSELETLNLGSFNTSNAAGQMYMMFQNCGNLTTIYVGRKWTVSNNGCYAMFSGCNSLVGGQGTKFIETKYVAWENTFAHIDGGPSNPGYLTAAPSLAIATSLNQVTSDKS
jgi:surface protein